MLGLLLAFALVLSWELVVSDCRGGPEVVVSYEFRGQHVRLLGWTADEPPAPIYSSREPLSASLPASVDTYWISGEQLLPGDVVWWEVDAVDHAGNRSGVCP